MKIVPVLIPLLLPLKVLAGTVLYTDRAHPPVNFSPGSAVVYLDGPQTLTDAMTGALPANPQQAEAMARQMMQSPAWREKDQQLRKSYLQVMHAWELGLKKYPAVVFDDRDVVYGTADIAQAQAIRMRGGQP
ncbi:TIGR03757 family integrating conjugative element protein [Enterobacteriaceae bacterium H11S18]|uniref:TIGR03757 family integrating conjugative element protein n=1 Tax=Dryocola clanedunensis TaxID=2925396 RepID=UPI0022F03900|nr:TIGR03757 family integrating conjugative element protein [Dryocola clanedunensis]MCT4711350.1 TIGR03757 family integrating conjugative element protein [Dryocola clanedunensis]